MLFNKFLAVAIIIITLGVAVVDRQKHGFEPEQIAIIIGGFLMAKMILWSARKHNARNLDA